MNDSEACSPRQAGWIDRSDRSRLVVEGAERSALLHSLTTQDINGLAPGRGAEAFFTSLQGKTLAYVTIHAEPDRLWIRGDSGLVERIGAHLDKYGLFHQAAWSDVGPSTREWHLRGPDARTILNDHGCAPGEPADPRGLDVERTSLAGVPIVLIRESPTGIDGWTVIAEQSAAAEVDRVLRDSGAVEISPAAWESSRIESGTLVDGRDVSADNLPQEFDRDARAIHFRKGCYLGQETVARLDAMGHVNRILRGFRLSPGPVPAPGTLLLGPDGRTVGKITSAAESPERPGPIALGFVRTQFAEPGTGLRVASDGDDRTATVASLPPAGGPG